MNQLTEKVILKTKAKLNTGQEFNVYVEPANDLYYENHPKITIEHFDDRAYMLGNLLIQYKSGILDKGLSIDGNLLCVNIKSILAELKKILNFNYIIS